MSMDRPYANLRRTFHEPVRLAILTRLLDAKNGLTFTELRERCGLTDGNLSRHLSVLSDAHVITIHKRFVRNRPQTRICLAEDGRRQFLEYLEALETVLVEAECRIQERSEETPRSHSRIHGAVLST